MEYIKNLNCTKCNKEYLENENVWCATCGCSYCKECAIIELPKNFDLPEYIEEQDLDDWQGDRGYTIEVCANCYKVYTDKEEWSQDKYSLCDILDV